MLDKITFDEALQDMVKKYITENLSVSVELESLYKGDPYAVQVSVSLEGLEICSDRAVF